MPVKFHDLTSREKVIIIGVWAACIGVAVMMLNYAAYIPFGG